MNRGVQLKRLLKRLVELQTLPRVPVVIVQPKKRKEEQVAKSYCTDVKQWNKISWNLKMFSIIHHAANTIHGTK